MAAWHAADPEFPGNISGNPLGGPLEPFLRVGKDIANGWLSSCGLPVIP